MNKHNIKTHNCLDLPKLSENQTPRYPVFGILLYYYEDLVPNVSQGKARVCLNLEHWNRLKSKIKKFRFQMVNTWKPVMFRFSDHHCIKEWFYVLKLIKWSSGFQHKASVRKPDIFSVSKNQTSPVFRLAQWMTKIQRPKSELSPVRMLAKRYDVLKSK